VQLDSRTMKKRRFFIRNIEAASHLEFFLVSAVAAILVIRGFLALTGYPQLGDDNLHIAHMLWGGLFMLISIIIMFTFLSKKAEDIAVVIGGIGFGTFVDEIGKFITQDNDYFYQPSIAIIYVVFILIVLTVRFILTRRYYSDIEYLMNAVHELEEVVLNNLDITAKKRILKYLKRSNPQDPLVLRLSEIVQSADTIPSPNTGLFTRLKNLLYLYYRHISLSKWFRPVIGGFFLFQLFVGSSYVVTLIAAEQRQELSFTEWAALSSSMLSALLVVWGVITIRRSRLKAYKIFERAILVSIFLTQVFVFYEEQFGALVGLTANLLIILALRFMIEREKESTV